MCCGAAYGAAERLHRSRRGADAVRREQPGRPGERGARARADLDACANSNSYPDAYAYAYTHTHSDAHADA